MSIRNALRMKSKIKCKWEVNYLYSIFDKVSYSQPVFFLKSNMREKGRKRERERERRKRKEKKEN